MQSNTKKIDALVAPNFEQHFLDNVSVDILWKYINPKMLFGKHMGIKGSYIDSYVKKQRPKDEHEEKAHSLIREIENIKDEFKNSLWQPKALFQFFNARRTGENQITIFDKNWIPIELFNFPRQQSSNQLCLSDYLSYENDSVAFFVTTAGFNVRATSEKLKEQGDYLKCHAISAIALELAEACAEYLHIQLRRMWNIFDPLDISMLDYFRANYHGKRYSFGYPACPNLDDQLKLFKLLNPANSIGVNLTDEMMMEPEASVSAIVFHSKNAEYFSV